MSVEQQVDRVVAGAKNTLKLLIQKLGGTVPDGTSIDGYADIVSGMTLDKMTPKAHKDTHKTGGSDALAPADIGAAAAGHTHTKANITDFPSSMTPSAHKNTHKTGGSDALAPSDIGAAAARHTHTTAQVEGLSDALTEVEPFIVEITLSGPTTASANKTFSEIKAASDAGRLCYVRANGSVAPLIGFKGVDGHGAAMFSATASVSRRLMTSTITIAEDNTVTIEDFSSQREISAEGLLKGDGQGDITAAVAGTDYLPPSGGTLTGPLVAQTNTSYTTAQMRNVIISTADPTGGNNGDIWLKYEA